MRLTFCLFICKEIGFCFGELEFWQLECKLQANSLSYVSYLLKLCELPENLLNIRNIMAWKQIGFVVFGRTSFLFCLFSSYHLLYNVFISFKYSWKSSKTYIHNFYRPFEGMKGDKGEPGRAQMIIQLSCIVIMNFL